MVDRFEVPSAVVADTERSLRHAGARSRELFVVWTGVLDGSSFNVRVGHVPPQTSYRTRDGLLVRVDGDALHQLNIWLYEHQQLLGAQVHAHPDRAYHSDTDDTFPIVTTLGGLSLVVPDFCRRGLLPRSAAYRLTPSGWAQSEHPVEQLIEVT
jgi:hypothetical protein